MLSWINSLRENCTLPKELLRELLECEDPEVLEYLRSEAQSVALHYFDRGVYIRGLIEITNRCRNNCYYCGIRCSNGDVERYSLDQETILKCCREGYEAGFRTFVMQGGEDPKMSVEWIVETVAAIRKNYPDCAITLSLGEMSKESYQRLFDAGANRYLLRHETHSEEHYAKLHPRQMSLKERLQCIDWLKEIGFQTGTGIMVGSPFQSIDNLVDDLLYISKLQPEMIGIGPFIPHHSTPFAEYAAGRVEMTLKLISILRLMVPSALIPATTALATLSADGRERGILAGANVVMPNLSPANQRTKYALYDNKASFGSEAAEGIRLLEDRLNKIGYKISYDRGDAPRK